MPTLTFRTFMKGSGAALQTSSWPPWLAILATLGVIAIGQLVPIVLISLLVAADRDTQAYSNPESLARLFDAKQPALLVATQAAMALATLFLASRYRKQATATLALVHPPAGSRVFFFAFALMTVALLALNTLTYTIAPESFFQDFRQFQSLVKGAEPWLVFAAVAIGAPLWEEFLFRGFLLPSVAQKLGFWPAALLVSAGWSALHIGYSAFGLIEVFSIGLLFAWLLRQAQSLWVPIACHATYNGLLFLALRTAT
ncbi:MAG: CPBP family intramembrane glutamic endopeptidase [Hyphomicrobiaceae bacterium]